MSDVLTMTEAYPGDPLARPLTLADVEHAVRHIPTSIREILRRGPIPGDAGCRVCRAAQSFHHRGHSSEAIDTLMEFHGQRRSEPCGPLDPEDSLAAYLRCLLIYLVAGWDGEHA